MSKTFMKSCPFCGASNQIKRNEDRPFFGGFSEIQINGHIQFTRSELDPDCYFVQCNHCKTRGPEVKNISNASADDCFESAVSVWNNRPNLFEAQQASFLDQLEKAKSGDRLALNSLVDQAVQLYEAARA